MTIRQNTSSGNLIITGLMGTGKTTVGSLLASELNRPFVDTDSYIEEHYGPAATILSQADGDLKFRQIEEEIALKLSDNSHQVISTGGRFMLNQANIDVMSESGIVVCLVADLNDIVSRLENSTTTTYRPRYQAARNKSELMRNLRDQSEPYFKQLLKIQTSGLTPIEVTKAILELAQK